MLERGDAAVVADNAAVALSECLRRRSSSCAIRDSDTGADVWESFRSGCWRNWDAWAESASIDVEVTAGRVTVGGTDDGCAKNVAVTSN